MPIRLLSSDVSSKIAAGEVVERPASIVKELVENSIDAGATEISVEIRDGGVESIRVTDNGNGIPFDEVPLAFHRFATSKVSVVDDLNAISTLGFRGEALPSITAVAAVTLTTRTTGEDSGTRIDVVEGKITRHEPAGTAQGTTISVRQLFRNFPARRKFLRTTATETSRVQTLVTRYALAYPEIRFRLDTSGSKPFASTGSGDLREAVASVYGLEVAESMLELVSHVEEERTDYPFVWGLISPPSVDRANRSYQSLYVNRRWVQIRSLGFALEQAYHGFLMERRYPLAVVNVSISPEEVDVNVHPAKTEVRFRRENQVFAALQEAVRSTLTAHSPVPTLRMPATPQPYPYRSSTSHSTAFWPIQPFDKETTETTAPGPTSQISSTEPQVIEGGTIAGQPPAPRKALPVLRVLGQVNNTYIVAEGPDGVYMIDQHAAHERIVFEKVRADMLANTPSIQSLLEPVTVELSARQQEIVESQHDVIGRMGMVVEPFGANVYLVRAVPSILQEGDPGQAFLDVLDLMADGGDFETWEERAAYSLACHGAIRAGKVLSTQEMSALTRQLEECQQPNNCPHGRPTMIHISSGHLEREFGRR